jgi:hypothetical protein
MNFFQFIKEMQVFVHMEIRKCLTWQYLTAGCRWNALILYHSWLARGRNYECRAIGTDGLIALYEAFLQVFQNATHLCCFSHFKTNVEGKLHDLGFPETICKEITKDIFKWRATSGFGWQSQWRRIQRKPGHVEVEREWTWGKESYVCKNIAITPLFHGSFTKEKAHIIESCMLKNVRVRAGMGKNQTLLYGHERINEQNCKRKNGLYATIIYWQNVAISWCPR